MTKVGVGAIIQRSGGGGAPLSGEMDCRRGDRTPMLQTQPDALIPYPQREAGATRFFCVCFCVC